MGHKAKQTALLSRGYFPKELPTAFTTEDFGTHADAILNEWKRDKVYKINPANKLPSKKKKRGSFGYELPSAEIEVISVPKRGFERRSVHITHPIAQALLSNELATNWKTILKWLARQTYSLDEVVISPSYPRSIKGINFALHRAKKGYIESTSDWLVKTDITRFYPSIYTHSIPWAAYGKETVKGNLKIYQGSLADRLDVLVRSCNRNQTVGIPIGPETSRVLAEIISSRIDDELRALITDVPESSVDRLQDDWFVGVKTLERAESCLASIMSVYREFGLEINGSKTSVNRVVSHVEESWISELGSFLSHRSGPVHGTRLREFLALTLRLQTTYTREPVVNYSLSVLENQQTLKGDVELLESFLLSASTVSPASMNRICQMLLNMEHDTKRVSRQRVGDRFTELIERNLQNGNLYEAIWLLYCLRGLGVHFKSKVTCDLAESLSSSALALVLLDLRSRGLCVHKLPADEWNKKVSADRIKSDWIWLLAYEGYRHGWLPDTKNMMTKPFFAPMASRNVVFYDPRKNVPRTAVTVRNRILQSRRVKADVVRFLLAARGFGPDEY